MIEDPAERGRALAAFYLAVSPRLFAEVGETELLPADLVSQARAQTEWECLALHACVRGLVAAGGFNPATSAAIDALHERVLEFWLEESADVATMTRRRDRLSERYTEYGAIDRAGGSAGAATATERVGAAAARHMTGTDAPPAALAMLLGALHETLAEGAAEAVRSGG